VRFKRILIKIGVLSKELCISNVSYIQEKIYVQGVSRLVDITAGGDFLGICEQKVHINMCPILDGYGVMTA
jgi:hypothetical protein